MTLSHQLQELAARYQQILADEQPAARQLVAEYRRIVESLATQISTFPSRPARPLTVPAIFGRSYDENFISDYMAYILDPSRNGIGTDPLAALCSLYGRDPTDFPLEEVTVYREYGLGSGRIDLLLEIDEQWVLGIENKIFSPEGAGQTPYYAKVIAADFPDSEHDLLFLTRGGVRPRSRHFQPLSYAALLGAFKTIRLPIDTGQKHRVLWQDFLEHLEAYIIMSSPDQFELSEKAQLYLEHFAMLENLRRSFRTDWRNAVDHLAARINTLSPEDLWQAESYKSDPYWVLIRKKGWQGNGLDIHIWWRLSPQDWLAGKVPFKLDVRAKKAQEERFLAQMDEAYKKVHTQYLEFRAALRQDMLSLTQWRQHFTN